MAWELKASNKARPAKHEEVEPWTSRSASRSSKPGCESRRHLQTENLHGRDWVDWRQDPGEHGFNCDFSKHYWALRPSVDRLRWTVCSSHRRIIGVTQDANPKPGLVVGSRAAASSFDSSIIIASTSYGVLPVLTLHSELGVFFTQPNDVPITPAAHRAHLSHGQTQTSFHGLLALYKTTPSAHRP